MEIIAKCSTTKARVGKLSLPHQVVDTPVFMPVGTQGTLKGVTTTQIKQIGIQIMLGNTYHLGNQPGEEVMNEAGGLHSFMDWDRALLTDSGGFQMVSLIKLTTLTEQGVDFVHPKKGTRMLLTPEKSMQIQNSIGADIMMQLDDVVSSTMPDKKRVKEATHRSIRWLDRCIKAHSRPSEQYLFPIIQGGLHTDLRDICLEEMNKRQTKGFAVGGLSGGESKNDFWRMVTMSTGGLPHNKPRYLMGVGYATDLVVCTALGCDMFDCVYPTRTARFGSALVSSGQLSLRGKKMSCDMNPVEEGCPCTTCKRYTRAYLHMLFRTNHPSACHLLTVHNVTYQYRLMGKMRKAIVEDKFPDCIREILGKFYPTIKDYPSWVVDALHSVGVTVA